MWLFKDVRFYFLTYFFKIHPFNNRKERTTTWPLVNEGTSASVADVNGNVAALTDFASSRNFVLASRRAFHCSPSSPRPSPGESLLLPARVEWECRSQLKASSPSHPRSVRGGLSHTPSTTHHHHHHPPGWQRRLPHCSAADPAAKNRRSNRDAQASRLAVGRDGKHPSS